MNEGGIRRNDCRKQNNASHSSDVKPMRASTRLIVESLRELALSGCTMNEAANQIGIGYGSVAKHARNHGINFARPTIIVERVDRNAEISCRYLAGEQQDDLAREYGITRERVRQICKRSKCASIPGSEFLINDVGGE